MRLRSFTLLVIVLLAGATMAYAQATSGTISGRVMDTQGLPVPGATVTASGPQGSKSATTDASGRFSIPFLVPDVYVVKAELAGFKAVEQRNVMVRLAQTVELALAMEVGGITETDEVSVQRVHAVSRIHGRARRAQRLGNDLTAVETAPRVARPGRHIRVGPMRLERHHRQEVHACVLTRQAGPGTPESDDAGIQALDLKERRLPDAGLQGNRNQPR